MRHLVHSTSGENNLPPISGILWGIAHVTNLIKKKATDFDAKLRDINKKVTSNKVRQIEAAKKLNHDIASYAKLINKQKN